MVRRVSGRSLPLCRCLGSAEHLEGSLNRENPVRCVGDTGGEAVGFKLTDEAPQGSGMKELQELFKASATPGKCPRRTVCQLPCLSTVWLPKLLTPRPVCCLPFLPGILISVFPACKRDPSS